MNKKREGGRMLKRTSQLKPMALFLGALMMSTLPSIALSQAPAVIPDFQAKALSGEARSKADLNGRPAFLIVNPSAEAGDKSKAWAQEIRRRFGPDVAQKTIIAVDVPFIVTEYIAIGRAQRNVDQRYWDRTWLMRNTNFEESLGIPSSGGDPHIFVLDANGGIVARVQGELDPQKINELGNAWRKVAGGTAPGRAPADSKSATTSSGNSRSHK